LRTFKGVGEEDVVEDAFEQLRSGERGSKWSSLDSESFTLWFRDFTNTKRLVFIRLS